MSAIMIYAIVLIVLFFFTTTPFIMGYVDWPFPKPLFRNLLLRSTPLIIALCIPLFAEFSTSNKYAVVICLDDHGRIAEQSNQVIWWCPNNYVNVRTKEFVNNGVQTNFPNPQLAHVQYTAQLKVDDLNMFLASPVTLKLLGELVTEAFNQTNRAELLRMFDPMNSAPKESLNRALQAACNPILALYGASIEVSEL